MFNESTISNNMLTRGFGSAVVLLHDMVHVMYYLTRGLRIAWCSTHPLDRDQVSDRDLYPDRDGMVWYTSTWSQFPSWLWSFIHIVIAWCGKNKSDGDCTLDLIAPMIMIAYLITIVSVVACGVKYSSSLSFIVLWPGNEGPVLPIVFTRWTDAMRLMRPFTLIVRRLHLSEAGFVYRFITLGPFTAQITFRKRTPTGARLVLHRMSREVCIFNFTWGDPCARFNWKLTTRRVLKGKYISFSRPGTVLTSLLSCETRLLNWKLSRRS